MLVAVRYLDRTDRGMATVIEDWYLPSDAHKTSYKDAAGRTLWLVGSKEQIAKECAELDKPGAVSIIHGHEFKYAGPVAAPKPVAKPVVVPPPVVIKSEDKE